MYSFALIRCRCFFVDAAVVAVVVVVVVAAAVVVTAAAVFSIVFCVAVMFVVAVAVVVFCASIVGEGECFAPLPAESSAGCLRFIFDLIDWEL